VVKSQWLGVERPRRKEGKWGEGPSLAITAMLCLEFAHTFGISVSIRKVASKHSFCVLIFMNNYISHICFILVISLSNTYLICDFICLTLSLADRNGIGKYTRTYIRRYTHTHAQKNKIGKGGKKKEEKEGGVREKRKKRENDKKETRRKKKRGKREKGRGGEKKRKRKGNRGA